MKDAHSKTAERALLGAMILASERERAAMFATIVREWFWLESHRIIWDSMVMIEREGKTFDTVNMLLALRDMGADSLRASGGGAYLSTLPTAVPTVQGWTHYAEKVREDFERRELANAYTKAAAGLESTPLESAAELVSVINGVLSKKDSQSIFTGHEASARTMKMLDSIAERAKAGKSATWMTSDPDLTSVLPLAPGFMHVLALPSGSGKTSIACNAAQFTAANGDAVGFHSVELSAELLNLRLMSRLLPFNELDVLRGITPDGFLAGVSEYLAGPARNPLYVTEPDPTIEDVERRVRYLYTVHGVRYHVLDYFQLLRASNRRPYGGSRSDELNDIGKRLKQLTRDLPGNALCVLAQLNKPQSWSGSTPRKDDIRFGSGLCDSADGVTLGWRPGKGTENDTTIRALLDKGRFGGETSVTLQWARGRVMGRFDEFYDEMDRRFEACAGGRSD